MKGIYFNLPIRKINWTNGEPKGRKIDNFSVTYGNGNSSNWPITIYMEAKSFKVTNDGANNTGYDTPTFCYK